MAKLITEYRWYRLQPRPRNPDKGPRNQSASQLQKYRISNTVHYIESSCRSECPIAAAAMPLRVPYIPCRLSTKPTESAAFFRYLFPSSAGRRFKIERIYSGSNPLPRSRYLSACCGLFYFVSWNGYGDDRYACPYAQFWGMIFIFFRYFTVELSIFALI